MSSDGGGGESGGAAALSQHGNVREDNKAAVIAECAAIKPLRLETFKATVDFLRAINVPFWIADGTLLSAVRENGVMLPWDIDTDTAIEERHFADVWRQRDKLHADFVLVGTDEDYTGTTWCVERDDGTIDVLPFKDEGAKKFVVRHREDKAHLAPLTKYIDTDIYSYAPWADDADVLKVGLGGCGCGS